LSRNSDYTLTRNDLVKAAHQKIGVLQAGVLSTDQLAAGIQSLNLIIREESGRGMGTDKQLWAEKRRALKLKANQAAYGTGTDDDELADDIQELTSAVYRDTSGDDTVLDIISRQTYDELGDKNDTGDPEKVYLLPDENLAAQELWVWPVVTSAGTTSEVIGTDGLNYVCTMGHTSSANNKPITGTDWHLYWDQQGSSGSTWATATAYTNGAMILYSYRRPLYDFDNPTDNPDMPIAWTRYLVYRLAYDLSPEYAITLEERQWLRQEYLVAREELFPSLRPQVTDFHNKAVHY